MAGSVVMVLLVGVVLLFIIGFYVALGMIIYKDAKAHGMPAGVWTLVALLIPNLIGVIIYLVVRANKEKNVYCSKCKTQVEQDYNICPQCQAIFEEVCQVCNKAIKEDQSICPYCGSEVSGDVHTKTAMKVSKQTKIAKPLIIISVVYFVGMFVVLFTAIGIGVGSYVEDVTIDQVNTNGWSTNISTISIDRSTKEKIKHSFHYTTQTVSRKLKVYADENPQIDIQITLGSGAVELQIIDENQMPIFEKLYEGNTDEAGNPIQVRDEVPLEIKEDQQYTIKFIYRKAKNGKIEITG